MDLKKILFGTHNKSKVARIKTVVKDLPIQIVGLNDLNMVEEPEEDGMNVIDNAVKKAKFYYRLSKMPTFSIDNSLYIDKLPESEQPGLMVRRAGGKKLTDREMIEYYSRQLEKIGGESKGKWVSGIAFVWGENLIRQDELVEERYFVSKPSKVIKEGFPLASLAIDLTLNQYLSEITDDERQKVKNDADRKIYNIFVDVLERIEG
ncbi:non-canonical purine NTP pyrophosphatase [Lihuaxuella thermophila]|uniref:Inosine/xanthosine triphosphate pyrophosphatase, all-alpha NTP-PPase family n=1 Tax=Lihuaxuella thermophila TaxID=1173111 RepID=A0A1H8C7N1_9BACL|nr:non-canonical purine NTP pyrophosphatase [Lihuaxuella thermophila]SEM90097.1 Inosine/xanthosine triphosphate pyrophosphatase, all-alpha NTP-PPase family [Lihuaxuella thermophila]